MTPLLIVGDSLLDRDLDGRVERLAPDAPVPVVDQPADRARPGGAALAALLAARDGREVTFVTALGPDEAGRTVADLLRRAGVTLLDVGADGPTGQKVRVHAAGTPVVRLDHGGASDRIGTPEAAMLAAIRAARTVLVADYGRGVATHPHLRAAIGAVADGGGRVLWDPHPRGPEPVPRTRLVTPNLAEATGVAGNGAADLGAIADAAAGLRARWDAAGVVVTLGARGAVLVGADGTPLVVPARPLHGAVDPCGAGDRFAVRVAGAIADGAVLAEAVVDGVRAATAFVADGGAGALRPDGTDPTGVADTRTPAGPPADAGAGADDVVATVRTRGGTVVATGGCFDLLHAGHVRLLDDARALGDCLVVCLNSDASVRRLKGAGRPVVSEADRRAVLLGLTAVDAVAVFDEDTPERVLADLRPDLWVKGGDYAVTDLPEADLLTRWGGRAVVLPYLDGRSTSAMIRKAERHVRS
jgi:D-beta-D-heptose 7-phosphate kinase/D-beta-D-heptose 1-phosphate adenosyltransferase